MKAFGVISDEQLCLNRSKHRELTRKGVIEYEIKEDAVYFLISVPCLESSGSTMSMVSVAAEAFKAEIENQRKAKK